MKSRFIRICGLCFLLLIAAYLAIQSYRWLSPAKPNHRQAELPQITNAEILCKESSILFGQYTNAANTNKIARRIHIVVIPKEAWPPSVCVLKPYAVDRDDFGISIWILDRNESEKASARGYYISCKPYLELPPNAKRRSLGGRFFFEKTRFEKIYEFEDPLVVW